MLELGAVAVGCYVLGVVTAPWAKPKLDALWDRVTRRG